ncbi:MAG: endonuclease III [Deltaproteobacteria bacterium]|nr:endonuclease III [Deltaproteobacteria bacterium]MBT4527584.1 endonuclease III [Deltaproteobacteria bacterium]
MKKSSVEQIFKLLNDTIQNPKSELDYVNHFQLLIAVILSAQTTDIAVNKATKSLFKKVITPESMLKLGEEKLKSQIKSIGLYNNKAKNIIKCCLRLIEEFNSMVPNDRKDLESLPGVGSKTAGVVLNIAFKKETIPVDTHVFRVSNRIGLVRTKTPDQTEAKLLKIVPDWAKIKAHHLLILHGRYTCKAKKPLCETCVINQYCQFKSKT